MAFSREKLASRKPLGGRQPGHDDLMYFAGLFDGEGSIDVANKSAPRLKISMTDGPTLHWLGETFGGRVYYEKPSGTGRLCAWKWCLLPRADVEHLLRLVTPFLRLKSARAQAALVAIEEFKTGYPVGYATLERVRARGHVQRFYPGTGPEDPRPKEQPPDEVSG